jgi:hypothetical protein
MSSKGYAKLQDPSELEFAPTQHTSVNIPSDNVTGRIGSSSSTTPGVAGPSLSNQAQNTLDEPIQETIVERSIILIYSL